MYITSVARLRFDIVYYTSRLRNEQNRRLHNNSWLMTLPLWCELHWLPHATSSGIRCTFKQEIHVLNDYRIFPETITPDTFNPPWHELSAPIQDNLKLLLQEYESQFTKDEMTIGTTPLTSMTIDMGTADPVSQKPYPIAMKHYQWVKDEIEKLLTAKVICTSCSSWSAPIIAVPKGDGGKRLVIDYRGLNKVTRKFTWPMSKVEDIFFQTKWNHIFCNLGPLSRIPSHPLG